MLQDLSMKHEESWSPFGRGTFSGADGSMEGREGADTVSHPVLAFKVFQCSCFGQVGVGLKILLDDLDMSPDL